jgi:LPPG:FO 2-phospho-L-lactate transferase
VRGWGREAESWGVFAELSKLGGPDWFQLGDKDLALHLIRAALLADGLGLCEVTAVLARRLGVTSAASIMPATEDRVRTRVITSEGEMAFQEYFVKHRCEPHLIAVRYEGIEAAKPALPLVSLLENAVGRGVDVVLGPSNPFLSLAPILDVPGMPNLLKTRARRVIAVSPIVEGQALKGPAAKIMSELGLSVSAAGWMQWMSDRYPGLIDVWVWDERDHELADTMRVTHPNIVVTDTVMSDPERARQFAERILRVSRDGD